MSTISISTPIQSAPVRAVSGRATTSTVSTGRSVRRVQPQVRLTRRGRVVMVLTFLALALGLMVAFGNFAIASKEDGKPVPVEVVQVQDGDTLYGIAGEFAEPGHVRDMVERLKDLNSLDGAQLVVGQKLAVPVR